MKSGCRQEEAMFFWLLLVTFDGNLGYCLAKTRGKRDKWNHIGVITYTCMKMHPCVQTKDAQQSRLEQSSQEQKALGQISDGAATLETRRKWQRSHLLLWTYVYGLDHYKTVCTDKGAQCLSSGWMFSTMFVS